MPTGYDHSATDRRIPLASESNMARNGILAGVAERGVEAAESPWERRRTYALQVYMI